MFKKPAVFETFSDILSNLLGIKFKISKSWNIYITWITVMKRKINKDTFNEKFQGKKLKTVLIYIPVMYL